MDLSSSPIVTRSVNMNITSMWLLPDVLLFTVSKVLFISLVKLGTAFRLNPRINFSFRFRH